MVPKQEAIAAYVDYPNVTCTLPRGGLGGRNVSGCLAYFLTKLMATESGIAAANSLLPNTTVPTKTTGVCAIHDNIVIEGNPCIYSPVVYIRWIMSLPNFEYLNILAAQYARGDKKR